MQRCQLLEMRKSNDCERSARWMKSDAIGKSARRVENWVWGLGPTFNSEYLGHFWALSIMFWILAQWYMYLQSRYSEIYCYFISQVWFPEFLFTFLVNFTKCSHIYTASVTQKYQLSLVTQKYKSLHNYCCDTENKWYRVSQGNAQGLQTRMSNYIVLMEKIFHAWSDAFV